MNIRRQIRVFGLLTVLFALLAYGASILVYQGRHSAMVQGVYAVGLSGLLLVCTVIHWLQAHRSGLFGLFAYLVTLLSLAYAQIAAFLTLAELSGIEEVRSTFLAVWDPTIRIAVHGVYVGFLLFGLSIAWSGVLPRWTGLLIALGAALQLPAQYDMETAGQSSFLIRMGGSALSAAGLAWIGWTLFSSRGPEWQLPGLSSLDRKWGGPFLLFAGILLAVDAFANMIGGVSLASGITHLMSYTALLVLPFLLYAGHREKAGWQGFLGLVFTQLGSVFYLITAYLILVQLAGIIDNNRALLASWVDIPVGRLGEYLSIAGMFLLGWEAIRSGMFPRGSGWLVVLGIALALPFVFTIQAYYLGILWVLGAILEGAGIAWMGWTLLRRDPAVEKAPLFEGTP